MDLSHILFILGSITTFILLLTPVYTFRHICRVSSVHGYSFLPYAASLVSYALWILYAMPTVHPSVPPQGLVTRALGIAGVIIHSVYVTIYISFSPAIRRPTLIIGVVCPLVAIGVIYPVALVGVHDHDRRLQFVGTLCSIASVVSSISPAPIIVRVIRTASVDSLPFLPTFFAFSYGLVWTLYALTVTPRDIFSLAPYTVAAGCGLAQLVIYAIYKTCGAADHHQQVPPMGEGGQDIPVLGVHVIDISDSEIHPEEVEDRGAEIHPEMHVVGVHVIDIPGAKIYPDGGCEIQGKGGGCEIHGEDEEAGCETRGSDIHVDEGGSEIGGPEVDLEIIIEG